MSSRVQVRVRVGRISVDLTVQEAIPLHLHGELYIPVKAIQMVKKPL